MIETFINTQVNYTIEHNGRFYIIENVPARVCKETGEQLFSPQTVAHIQDVIEGSKQPQRMIETPVYKFA